MNTLRPRAGPKLNALCGWVQNHNIVPHVGFLFYAYAFSKEIRRTEKNV